MRALQVLAIVVRLVAAAVLLVILSLLHSTIDASAQRLQTVGNEAIAYSQD